MLSGAFSSKSALPAPVAAAQRKTAASAAAALFALCAKAATAHAQIDAGRAKLAEVERERAEVAPPTTDDAAIDARLRRREHLTMKAEGHRAVIVADEENARVCDAAVAEATAALRKAFDEIGKPPADTPADSPRLKAEAEKTTRAAQTAREAFDSATREAAPALAACKAMLDHGAPADDALRILEAEALARARIAAAETEYEAADEAADAARRRVDALEARLERERRSAKFKADRERLESQHAGLAAAVDGFNQVGAQMGGLVAAGGVYVKASGNNAWLTLAPKFVESAFIPILGDKDGRAFVTDNWRHDYSRFETPKLLQPLLAGLHAKGAVWSDCRRAALDAFDAEYQRLGNRLLEPAAFIYLWLIEREAAFAAAGDLARGVAKPAWPLQSAGGGDFAPWRRLCLPSLRPGGAALWEPHWSAARLLELTKTAKAA